ncbi:AraC family transcriptional regulator [Algiphilus sp. W345]|uniref:AraC family transcriptional regulator n=1 Tax=Banduia mediterranea TaxID=3075609 RepID=A0ABU2WKP0_9GAMM|nr:AraC family transcriptional regulator [Algiphilus sp. W345]MDT0498454.1 AraC family transcriptional regulator [Algiphilus sp. W345]
MPVWTTRRSAISARQLTELAVEHGLPRREILRGTGTTEAELDDPGAEIDAAQELALVARLVECLGHVPGLGLQAGSRYRLTSYGIWGFAMMSSATLRSAIALGLRYLDLTYAFNELRVEEGGREAALVLDDHAIPQALREFLVERDAAAIHVIASELLNEPLPQLGIDLRYPGPAHAHLYEAMAGVCPHFGAADNRIRIDASILDRAPIQADAPTARLCREQCDSLLRQRHSEKSGFSARVQRLLRQHGETLPSLELAARQLRCSARTLRRRLAEQGSSYRQLVAVQRREHAERLLDCRELSVEQIAAQLGYAESASFIHAYKRWRGVTPNAARSAR